jgi:hypothetical protein
MRGVLIATLSLPSGAARAAAQASFEGVITSTVAAFPGLELRRA